MTNKDVIFVARSRNMNHAILTLPATPAFHRWLNRPLQFPVPFAHLRVGPLQDRLDALLAEWRRLEACEVS